MKMKDKEISKGGRKPKHDYNDQMFLLQIEGWARDGYDDKQIAEMLDLDPATFSRKKSEMGQLSQALSRGRRPLEVLVENSLFKRATGMKVTRKTVTRKLEYNPATGESEYVTYESEEINELAPDVKAQELWLRNRKPKSWNTQPNKVASTDPSGEKQAPLLFISADSFTPDQIQDYIKKNIEPDKDEVSGND